MNINFYRFNGAYKKGAVRIAPLAKYNTLKILDDDTELNAETVFQVKVGVKMFDIIQFFDSMSFAISEKVKDLLEANNVTGWKCFKIKIEGINENYYAFQNLAKAGPILNLEAINNYEAENREFDLNTWDGSDVFNLENTLLNVITLRVKNILEENKVTNIRILPL